MKTECVHSDRTGARIAEAARRHFMSQGFNRTTMEELSGTLGMSKKTLYAYFPSKEAIVAHLLDQKIETVRKGACGIVDDESASFCDRAHRLMAFIVRQISEVSPVFLRDLERHYPELFARIESVRAELLPEVWGKLLRAGVEEGHVRRELDPAFISQVVLFAVQGMQRPASLERHGLAPHEAIDGVLTILFNGILTPAGRKAYEQGPSRIP